MSICINDILENSSRWLRWGRLRGFLSAFRLTSVALSGINASLGIDLPEWRNGRRGGFKIHWGNPRVGSNPTFGTNIEPRQRFVFGGVLLYSKETVFTVGFHLEESYA